MVRAELDLHFRGYAVDYAVAVVCLLYVPELPQRDKNKNCGQLGLLLSSSTSF